MLHIFKVLWIDEIKETFTQVENVFLWQLWTRLSGKFQHSALQSELKAENKRAHTHMHINTNVTLWPRFQGEKNRHSSGCCYGLKIAEESLNYPCCTNQHIWGSIRTLMHYPYHCNWCLIVLYPSNAALNGRAINLHVRWSSLWNPKWSQTF